MELSTVPAHYLSISGTTGWVRSNALPGEASWSVDACPSGLHPVRSAGFLWCYSSTARTQPAAAGLCAANDMQLIEPRTLAKAHALSLIASNDYTWLGLHCDDQSAACDTDYSRWHWVSDGTSLVDTHNRMIMAEDNTIKGGGTTEFCAAFWSTSAPAQHAQWGPHSCSNTNYYGTLCEPRSLTLPAVPQRCEGERRCQTYSDAGQMSLEQCASHCRSTYASSVFAYWNPHGFSAYAVSPNHMCRCCPGAFVGVSDPGYDLYSLRGGACDYTPAAPPFPFAPPPSPASPASPSQPPNPPFAPLPPFVDTCIANVCLAGPSTNTHWVHHLDNFTTATHIECHDHCRSLLATGYQINALTNGRHWCGCFSYSNGEAYSTFEAFVSAHVSEIAKSCDVCVVVRQRNSPSPPQPPASPSPPSVPPPPKEPSAPSFPPSLPPQSTEVRFGSAWYGGLIRKGSLGNTDVGAELFNALFFDASPSRIIYRHCPDCVGTHQHIFYKRLTPATQFRPYEYLYSGCWRSADNLLRIDFNLYSSYADALADRASWQSCNYDDCNYATRGVGGFRDCGPSLLVGFQWVTRKTNYEFLISAASPPPSPNMPSQPAIPPLLAPPSPPSWPALNAPYSQLEFAGSACSSPMCAQMGEYCSVATRPCPAGSYIAPSSRETTRSRACSEASPLQLFRLEPLPHVITHPSSSATPVGVFRFHSFDDDGFCMSIDPAGGGCTKIMLEPCSDAEVGQQWHLTIFSGTIYNIENGRNHMVFDAHSYNGCTNGNEAWACADNRNAAKKWRLVPTTM